MDDDSIIAGIAELTGDLSPGPQATADDLKQARAAVAAAVITAQTGGFLRSARELGRPELNAAARRAFAEIAQQVRAEQPAPQLVAQGVSNGGDPGTRFRG